MLLLRPLTKRLRQQCTFSTTSSGHLGAIKLDYSILDDPVTLAQACKVRNINYSEADITALKVSHEKSKESSRLLEDSKAKQNSLTKLLKSKLDAAERAEVLEEASQLSKQVASLAKQDSELSESFLSDIASLPNATHPSVPAGNYDACRTIRTSGPPPSALKAQAHKDHLSIATQLQWVDFTSGAKVTGSRWYFLLNEGALLELALTNYAVSIAIQAGFTPTLTPDVTKEEYAHRTGFSPRDEKASQSYSILSEGEKMTLAGTAEIPLAGHFSESTFDEMDLPKKMVGVGKAYRAEAGARGKASRGLYRVHHFSKVELFVVCGTEESEGMLEELVALQEKILNGLGLPLRTLEMSTEELGASAYRKYDIEAWMPGRGSWGEVASASNCTDYQSRRLDIRYKPTPPPQPPSQLIKRLDDLDIPIPPHIEATAVLQHEQPKKKEGKTLFAHTLNATAAAIPRLILALIENGASFDAQGEVFVKLPKVLRGFWAGPSDEVGVKRKGSQGYVVKWV